MPSATELNEALEAYRKYSTQLDKSIQGQQSIELEDGTQVEVLVIGHGSYNLEVAVSPEWEYANLQFSIDLKDPLVAQQITAQQAGQGGPSPDQLSRATDQIDSHLDQFEDDYLRNTRIDVLELANGSNTYIQVETTTSPGRIHAVQFKTTMFPYDGMTVEDFEAAVQRVISAGHAAKELLMLRYNLDDLYNGGGGKGHPPGPTAFQ